MAEKWVLIIDDGQASLDALKAGVESLSPDFHAVTSMLANEAYAHLSQHKFDLVVLDDKMGESRDMELLDAVQNLQPDAAVLLMAANRFNRTGGMTHPFMPYPTLPKPVDLPSFQAMVREVLGGVPDAPHPDFLILSDERYKQVNQLLARLKSDIGARCIFLTDAEGLVITRIGMVDQIPLEQIASLIAGSMVTLLEAGRVIDGESDTINLAYRDGKNENLCVVNVGKKMLLIIVFGKGPYSSRLGTVWYFARRTAQTLLGWINTFEDARPGQLFVSNVEKAVGTELDFIRQEKHTAGLPARAAEDFLPEAPLPVEPPATSSAPLASEAPAAAAAPAVSPFLEDGEGQDDFSFWNGDDMRASNLFSSDPQNPLP